MLGADHEYGLNQLRRLNGDIHVIRGNHDTDRRWEEYESIGFDCIGYSTVLKAGGWKFYLSHYKTETSCLENMAALKYHMINLHGHSHSRYKFENGTPMQYNVALDAHANFPVSLSQIQYDIEAEARICLAYL